MSRTTPERIETPQFAALAATVTQLLGKNSYKLNPVMVQRNMQGSRHEKLARKLLAVFEPDAEDWINAYHELYEACGFDRDFGIEQQIRANFHPGWWPIAVARGMTLETASWAVNQSVGLEVEKNLTLPIPGPVQKSYVLWTRANSEASADFPMSSEAKRIGLMEQLVLGYAYWTIAGELLDQKHQVICKETVKRTDSDRIMLAMFSENGRVKIAVNGFRTFGHREVLEKPLIT